MATYMDEVPRSNHSIFIRGFPGNMEMNKIRDFFAKQFGHCTFDFFKTSQDQSLLYVAIRFDTHDIAKEVLKRFNRKEVLGCIIMMEWFRDVKRFYHAFNNKVLYPGTTNRIGSSGFSTRAAPNSRQFIVRGRGRAAYNNNANNNNNSQFNNNSAIRNVSGSSINKSVTNTIHSSQPYGRGRSQVLRRRPKRSHSRSRSRSRSRSSSRSRSRGRSRTRSYDYKDDRSRTPVRRRKTRSRTLSDSPSKSSPSRSSRNSRRPRSPYDGRRSTKDSSVEQTRIKPQPRLFIDTTNESNGITPSPKVESNLASNWPNFDTERPNSNILTPTGTKQFYVHPQPFSLPPKLRYFQGANIAVANAGNESGQEFSQMDNRHAATPPYNIIQQINTGAVPTPVPVSKISSLKPRSMSEVEKAVNNEFWNTRTVSSEEVAQNNVNLTFINDTKIEETPVNSINSNVAQEKSGQTNNAKVANRLINVDNKTEQIKELNEPARTVEGINFAVKPANLEPARTVEVKESYDNFKRTIETTSPNRKEQNTNPRNLTSNGNILTPAGHQNIQTQTNLTKEIADISNSVVQDVLTDFSPDFQNKVNEKDQNSEDVHSKAKILFKSTHMLSKTAKQVASNSDRRKKINSLSSEQIDMLHKKRQELEQAYRQDCDTFATVVKMLISKDPALEEKLVNSLRESLKDIGEKFIEELNSFIDDLLASEENN